MAEMKKIIIYDEVVEYPSGTQLWDIAKDFKHKEKYDIVLAVINNRLKELSSRVTSDCEIRFITCSEKIGLQTYKRSLTLLMLKAFNDIVGGKKIGKISVEFALSKGYYCELEGNVILTQQLLDAVEVRMQDLVDADVPITKRTLDTDTALELFKRHRMYEKEMLFKFRKVSKVNLYSLNSFEDYYYGYMVPSTSYLKYFKLYLYKEGFVMQMPTKEQPTVLPPFHPQEKLFQVMSESTYWAELLGLDSVGGLNESITKGNFKDMILVQEALQESKIAELAKTIASQKDKKFIMIAGPSSSGKTTFSHRLSIQLRANGLKPHPIPVDDYFVNRDNSPKDADGKNDYESLGAIDVKQFNKDMIALANGEEVELPTYNFVLGRREYKGKALKLGKDDILVIEGIHCLNDKLSYALPKESKFKIYISALTQLNIDEHNRISTTDCRLIRRMVRDERTRGTSARETIAMWPSVRRGEEKHIFPYQETADAMFNSALIYELSVLKQFAEPILFNIPTDCPEHFEAKRLLKFLDYFLGVSSEDIPKNSLIREFVGGSTFNV